MVGAAVLGCTVGVVGVGGVAAAFGDDPVIGACVVEEVGTLRVVDGEADCGATETYIEWNKEGAVGPAGPQGEVGPQGPQGRTGAPGPAAGSGRTTGYSDWVRTFAGKTYTATAQCPKGTVVTGGGVIVNGYGQLGSSYAGSDTAWTVKWTSSQSYSTFRVQAVCVNR